MTFPRYTRPVHHLLEVGQVLASIASFWRNAWASIVLCTLYIFRLVFTCIAWLLFVFPVTLSVFLVSGRGIGLAGFLFRGRLLDFESRWQFTLLDQALLQQVVHCGHLVVLVPVQALSRIVFLKAIAFKVAQQ